MDNACRYTPSGGKIVLGLKEEIDTVQLFIRDTGIGITKEQMPFIFDRFYRGDKSGREKGSSGLGLALAKWIAEQHRATITVESEPGIGSCFRISMQRFSPMEGASASQRTRLQLN